jgi:hypothetical protein
LDEALRRYLAWESILAEKETLDLSPIQAKQAETQMKAADGAVTARLPEAYCWLLVPEQATPQGAVTWKALRLTGNEALAPRASRKLKHDELLVGTLGASILRKHLDEVPLWRGEHVAIKQLSEDFARYLYLPRLRNTAVLVAAVRDGVALLSWRQDSFAFAENHDETAKRYRGLRAGQQLHVSESDLNGVLLKPDTAQKQLDEERAGRDQIGADGRSQGPGTGLSRGQTGSGRDAPGQPPLPPPPPKRRRFHGSIKLDPQRVGRDAGRVAEEIVQHLALEPGATVEVTLEIQAQLPAGASDNVIRIVTENARTLNFGEHAFEQE